MADRLPSKLTTDLVQVLKLKNFMVTKQPPMNFVAHAISFFRMHLNLIFPELGPFVNIISRDHLYLISI